MISARFYKLGLLIGFSLQAASAQTDPLVPFAAKAHFDAGVRAARDSNWPSAINEFQAAEAAAPGNGPILFNLALAESKVPGRELRSIAWFKAYLDAIPNPDNLASVIKEIQTLETRARSQIFHWLELEHDLADAAIKAKDPRIQSLHTDKDACIRMALRVGLEADAVKRELEQGGCIPDEEQGRVIRWFVYFGHLNDAKELAYRASDKAQKHYVSRRDGLLLNVAIAQARMDDVSGALRTLNEAKVRGTSDIQTEIAYAEMRLGHTGEAHRALGQARDLILKGERDWRDNSLSKLIEDHIALGDTAGAGLTLGAIHDRNAHSFAVDHMKEGAGSCTDKRASCYPEFVYSWPWVTSFEEFAAKDNIFSGTRLRFDGVREVESSLKTFTDPQGELAWISQLGSSAPSDPGIMVGVLRQQISYLVLALNYLTSDRIIRSHLIFEDNVYL